MLDSIIVVGVVALILKIVQEAVPAFQSTIGQLVSKLALFMAIGLVNILNGWAFGTEAFTTAVALGYFRDGLILGAAASGIYDLGKTITTNVNQAVKTYRAKHRN